MGTMLFVLLCCLCLVWAESGEKINNKFQVAFEWNYVNFTWDSPQQIKKYKYSAYDYIPVGIRVHEQSNRIYLALPRVKPKARITLAYMHLDSPPSNPKLTPYPSWELNFGDSCDTLQNVQAMDIGLDDVMWVLDGTRNNKKVTSCPAKIVLLDLKQDGKVLQSYDVPDDLCSVNNGCYLNDLIVDGDYAYCSDYTTADPGIFVYNRKLNKSWKIRNNRTMQGDPEATNFKAQGVKFTSVSPINGIALSPNCHADRTFYYTPQTSFKIYGIPTKIISNPCYSKEDVDGYIQTIVTKPAATGGMIGDSLGDIYFGLLPLDAVAVKYQNESGMRIVDLNSKTITWPDSFAFDLRGNLYMTATNILRFSTLGIDIDQSNFRILKLYTGTKSYHYCEK